MERNDDLLIGQKENRSSAGRLFQGPFNRFLAPVPV